MDVGSATCIALLRMVYGRLQDLMPTKGAHAPQLVPVYPLFRPRLEGPRFTPLSRGRCYPQDLPLGVHLRPT